MSYNTRIGGSAFNHSQSADAEAEYDRLRDLARKEQSQHQHWAAEARQAYERGDGASAHEASQKSKQFAAQADDYNKQASDYIFRQNNAVGRVDSDTIDLHGQFVEEAEEIVTQRIKYAQQNGQTHLHVIVGKGNHSVDHIQKIKPAVENICRELGLQYNTEHNEGRIYINLTGGEAIPPSHQDGAPSSKYSQEQQGQPQYQSAYPLGGYAGQSQQYATQHHQYTNGQETYAQAAGGQQQQPQYAGKQTQQQQQQQQQQQFDYQEEGKEETGCLPILINLLKKCFS